MRGITAQGRRLGGGGRTGMENWKMREVGSAYLLEKLRGKAEREAIGDRRLQRVIAGDDEQEPKLHPTASYDDEEPRLQCTASDDDREEPKLRPTNNGYAPNSSRKRRRSCAKGVEALQDSPKVIEPVRSQEDDWREARGLGYALILELLRATLLILPMIVHEEQYRGCKRKELKDKGTFTDDKKQHTDRERSTDNTTNAADCIGLTDGRKHLMLDDEDLQYTTFPHPSISVSPATLTTPRPSSRDSQASDSQENLHPQAAMSTMFYMPMPPPGTLGSPMFEGANCTEFLERYEDLCADYRVSEEDKLTRLPRYCIQPIAETIKSLKEWKSRDFAALKKALLAEYRNDDTRQLLYSVPFLESYKNIARTEKDDIMDYCRKFDRIAQHCMEKKVLTEYTAGIWFIHGLPVPTASRLIRKFTIDTEDPATVDYKQQLEHVMRQTASDKAIQRMNATRAPSQQQTEVVDQIIGQLRPTVSVTKEQRLAEPVVKPTKPTALPETTMVDQLTKAFEKLSVNLIQQVQQPASGSHGRYPYYGPGQQSYTYPEALKGSQNTLEENIPSVNVGAYGAYGTGRSAYGGRSIGVCWYCLNQDPRYQDPPHKFREQCPWYRRHLAIGTAHVNENGRLARGPPRPGAPEFFIQPGRPEGIQVVMATAGTPEDENIENRPKDRAPPSPRAAVASITLLSGADSTEDEEEDDELEIFQTSAARVERAHAGDEKWRNPTKILKRAEPRERKFAVPKTVRPGEWKPAVVEEDMEIDRQEFTDEPAPVKVENNPERTRRRQRTQKKRYLDVIKEAIDPEVVFDEVMKQPVTIKLQDLLVCSPTFAKLLFKGIPVQEEAEVPTASIGSVGVRRHKKEKTYAAKTPKLLVKVDGVPTRAMLDTGAEVNVITRAAADELGLPVRTDLLLALKAVSGDTRVFDGACEDVEIDIGGVINYQTLLVLNESEHTLILGAPFFHDAQVTFEYDEAGNQYAKVLGEDREKVATVRVCVPQSKGDRERRAEADLEGKD
jgi:hypothetical protein